MKSLNYIICLTNKCPSSKLNLELFNQAKSTMPSVGEQSLETPKCVSLA